MNITLLFRKDLRLHGRMLLPLIALEIAAYIAYAVQMPSAIPGVAFGLMHGVALIGDFLICHRTLIAEEKNRAFRYLKALPVTTREIVLAKFAVNFLFVTLNTLALLATWSLARAAGRIHARPALSLALVLMGITLHCLNNAFFLALGLIFDSSHAVWIPFPALFLLMSLLVNFRKLAAALHIEAAVHLLGSAPALLALLVWLAIAAFLALSCRVLDRKRVFA